MLIRLLFYIFIFNVCTGGFALAEYRSGMSLEQAVKEVRQKSSGRVLSATTRKEDSRRATHNVRILTPGGQVKRYRINEQTGQYIRPSVVK